LYKEFNVTDLERLLDAFDHMGVVYSRKVGESGWIYIFLAGNSEVQKRLDRSTVDALIIEGRRFFEFNEAGTLASY